MNHGMANVIEELRARIQAIEGAGTRTKRWQTGVTHLDELLGGIPTPGCIELTGLEGSGALSVAMAITARVTQLDQWVGWLDGDGLFYPPGACLQGVDLQRLMLVRPIADRSTWAAEQLIASGCFPWVVITGDVNLGRGGSRWNQIAERGNCCVCVVRTHSERRLPAHIRLHIARGQIRVVRNRSGPIGRSAPLPSQVVEPWM